MWRKPTMPSTVQETDGSREEERPKRSLVQVSAITPGFCALIIVGALSLTGVFSSDPPRDKTRSRTPDQTIRICDGLVLATTFSPDSQTVAIASSDAFIKLWNLASGHLKKIELPVAARSIAYSPDGSLFASSHTNHHIHIFNGKSGDFQFTLESQETARVITFDPRGSVLAAANSNGTITLWNLSTHKPQLTLHDPISKQGRACQVPIAVSMGYTPDGRFLVTGDDGGSVRFWDLANGQLLHKWQAHSTPIDSLAISPQGNLVATATCLETEVKLWDLPTGQSRSALLGHEKGVKGLDFELDGKTLVSAGADQMVRIWDLRTSRTRATLTGHEEWAWTLHYSPDGKWIVSGGSDGTVRLWQTARLTPQVAVASR